MREEEIVQIVPAPWGWYAYGQDEQGAEFLAPWPCGPWCNRTKAWAAWSAWVRTGWARLAAWRTCRGLWSTVTSLRRGAREPFSDGGPRRPGPAPILAQLFQSSGISICPDPH